MTVGARTQVGIIGAGPAGLLLGELLATAGVDSVILEARDRAYVEGRIRAGVLEQGTVSLLERAGVGDRPRQLGIVHNGCTIVSAAGEIRIDFATLTGRSVIVWGQTEVTRDLIEHRLKARRPIVWQAADVAIADIDTDSPTLTWHDASGSHHLQCDFIAGCDGFHGVSRQAIPATRLRTVERDYPFSWLGILADVPPCSHELVYASHNRGFALASMRSTHRSRYYIQCPPETRLEDWPDDRIWNELAVRLGPKAAAGMTRGPAIEKSIAPLRSFVASPLRHGRLFLAGDAAHIVPPTGAKGLNLAASDVHYLSEALIFHYRTGSPAALDAYSDRALARVWQAERFSWWMTSLLHQLHPPGSFAAEMQRAELEFLSRSAAARTALAECYVGLPL
ncbi:MAG: 4-hydroxybenzoate 3-monooxygenase [Hyphomicrobiaceae bacterium]